MITSELIETIYFKPEELSPIDISLTEKFRDTIRARYPGKKLRFQSELRPRSVPKDQRHLLNVFEVLEVEK